MVEWQTHYTQNVAPQGVRVQVPSSAPIDFTFTRKIIMSNITNEDVVAALGNLTVLEIIALTRQLETQWGVKAEPLPVEMKQPEVEKASVQTEFNVILVSCPADKKMNVIKAVRDLLKLGLKESKDLVEAAPKMVMEGASREDADNLRNTLTDSGAVIEVK